MMKLTLNLGSSELRTLYSLTRAAFAGYPIERLKAEVGDYLILSCLEDLYMKLEGKARAVALYGLPAGRKVKLSLKRHEAIAMLHILEAERSVGGAFLPAFESNTHEAVVMATLSAEIQKVFL